MAIDYAALASEINVDPLTLGYAPLKAAGNDSGIAALLNNAALGGGTLNKRLVTAAELQTCVVATEYAALSVNQTALWQAILTAAANGGVLVNDAQLTAQALQVFTTTGTGSTRSKLTVLKTRTCSRAETLFGEGTLIAASDVAHAYSRS